MEAKCLGGGASVMVFGLGTVVMSLLGTIRPDGHTQKFIPARL